MTINVLSKLEEEVSGQGLLLRLQVRRPLDLWAFRLVVAEEVDERKIRIWGEMKGWAYKGVNGLQLDTMQVNKNAPIGVGYLIWAATMLWALEETPCRHARLLAIHDEDNQHARLIKYFERRKFKIVRDVGASLIDLPLRLIWGGAGSLMIGECREIFEYSYKFWQKTK